MDLVRSITWVLNFSFFFKNTSPGRVIARDIVVGLLELFFLFF
jgi:hypothetical protein